MRKIFILATLLVTTLTLTACDSAQLSKFMSSAESLSALSYISASFLDETVAVEETPVVSSNIMKLSSVTEEPTTEIEEELEQVNIYVDKLKSFMENGAENFGDIQEQASDRAEYLRMIVITVDESSFVLYYNIDITTNEISGLFVLDGVEYTITAQNNLEDAEEFEDDDSDEEDDLDVQDNQEETEETEENQDQTETDESEDSESQEETEEVDDEVDSDDEEDDELDSEDEDEEDEEENESEYGMTLVATNGEDTITISYEVEQEDSEVETSFHIVKDIDGVVSELEIEIEKEVDEYSMTITEDGNVYEFKVETEDGEVEYKLEYEVNGIEGEVKIEETTNDLGETIYEYKISEDGEEVEVELDDPDEDDDEEETEEESEERDDESNEV